MRNNFRRSLVAFAVLALMAAVVPLITQVRTAEAQVPQVVINEFLAINDSTLADNTGQFADWIELRNNSGSSIDIAGWTIADGGESFVFPAGTTITSGGYLLLWASGDVTRTVSTHLHLPFRLGGGGDSLLLRTPLGAISSPAWIAPTEYPPQLSDDSYGIASDGELRYFTGPTPGAANGGGVGGLVNAVSFSVEHGFYESSQSVALTTSTPSATIRYTTDGSTPTASNGTAITPGNAVDVSDTTTLRAVAYRDGWITSPVETRTYLFTNDIIQQGQPLGWPSGPINGQEIDYGMDPNVVDGNETAVEEALTSIPSISIVTDRDNLLDPSTGIYVNASERGGEWERQASVELIDPNGLETGFDIEAGIRIRGGFSRRADNPKHALRLYFRDDYESELNYPFFGDEGVDEFEIMDLRTASNYAWSWRHTTEATFIDELWSRDTQAAMGQPYTRSRPYHVYLNGTYWGLYQSQERVSGEYGESYFGGTEDDYDVVKRAAPDRSMEASDGTDVAWKSLYPLVSDLTVSNAEYNQIDAQVDLVNLADYYLLHFWSGDFDGSPSRFFGWQDSNNWFALRNRDGVGPAAKWQFFDHDSEHSLCAASFDENMDNTTPWNLDTSDGEQWMTPSFLHAALITNDAYRQIFVDRVQLHMLTPGGALTVPEALARLNARVAEVSPAIEGESARWGDGGGEPAFGRSEWQQGVAEKRNCFALREPVVISQLQADGLWPLSEPPTIAPAAGSVPFGTNVVIDDAGQGGTIWYTLDGSDPRAPGGAVSANATQFTGPFSVQSDLTVSARIRIGGQWTPIAAASFSLSTTAGPVPLLVNEFNATSSGTFLGGGTASEVGRGSDTTFGRIVGNGGDWFELVVLEETLDIRGWTAQVWNADNGILSLDASLTFGNDVALSELLAGSLVTVSEDIADDITYSPFAGDWHINLQANNAKQGSYITASSQTNFAINSSDTQIALFDATGMPVALRTGEGTVPGVAVGANEVFKLEGTPASSVTADSSLYGDGTSSTWGLTNSWNGGAQQQDLSTLRIIYGDVTCDGMINVFDALAISQYNVGIVTGVQSCPVTASQINLVTADVNNDGFVNVFDAFVISECVAGVNNVLCPG